ncbi:hypothetical protein SE17_07270 [Kouleothrix aurantiaca]|uniref:Peptidase S8/S53 domain-containing protein n=1 Tax=Kouleothrix aurantiaca TaxID=186479 RepID=A0A0P9DUT2_9CHLR|nr:hypothetical protein SE17_07270 [Kouleothrix aurantiaca]
MGSKARRTRRLLSLGLIALAILAFPPAALAQRPGTASVAPRVDPRAKIHPNLLREMTSASNLRSGDSAGIAFVARIRAGADLSRYASDLLVRPFADPAGGTVAYGHTSAAGVLKLASLDTVFYLQRPESLVEPPAPPKPEVASLNSKLAFKLNMQPGAGPAPDGWYDSGKQIHGSKEAWKKGYTGAGVRLMVNDSGADYCQADLYGTWAYIDDKRSPYYGLPEMFDSISSFLAARDAILGETNIRNGFADYADTSTKVSGSSTQFQPIGAFHPHTYTLPPGSKSGVYHIGSHPDNTLASDAEIQSQAFGDGTATFGERAAVLVVDSHKAGVYDRVYVDLNYNFDFTDDRPATLDRTFRRHEVACLDYNEDGLFDISGGLVYFISDGTNAVPTMDWYWGVPGSAYGPGDLVAFHVMDAFASPAGDHGMGCTSVAVGQGRVRGSVYYGPSGPPQAGGKGLVLGPGKDVLSTQNGDFYSTPFIEDAYIFAGLGYDGESGTADDVQIVSNSWGNSGTDNDGWDGDSRLIDLLNRTLAPQMTILFATGNGAAGYGTATPPKPASGIGIGASTLFDDIGVFEPIASAKQIVGGDPIPWSDRGPGATVNAGVDAIATGAFGVGSVALNEVGDGAISTASFGGTSMATPVAAGNLALMVDAWKQRTGHWPSFEEARALLMGSARNTNHDVWTQGAGLVNADEGTDVAGGRSGAYATPAEWAPGSYRGKEYAAFANIIAPGASDRKTFTLWNAGDKPLKVRLGARQLQQIGTHDYSFTSLDASLDHGDIVNPDYVVRIDKDIPPGTDLLQVREAYPYDQFNPSGTLGFETEFNSWNIHLLNWTDLNRDGAFWHDANSNGKVDITRDEIGVVTASEMDPLEFVRFSYGDNTGPTQQARVGNPLKRKADGILLSFRHSSRPETVPHTDLKVEASFWQQQPWSWVDLDRSSITIPARGKATFRATMRVPASAPFGMYEGSIVASYRGHKGDEEIVIPVTTAVAAAGGHFDFGAKQQPAAPQLYDNSALFGYTDYDWRNESGDWRFFWTDVRANDLPKDASPFLLIDNRWNGANSDIDTLVMGPAEDCFSNGVQCTLLDGYPGDTAIYGPYTLAPVGGSPNTYLGSGRWAYQTSSDGPHELVATPAKEGLHGIFLHQVRMDGSQLDERFQGQAGLATLSPASVTGSGSGSASISLHSDLALENFSGEGFGLSQPLVSSETAQQDNPNNPATSSVVKTITLANAAELNVSTAGPDGVDIDLYVLDPFGNLAAASTSSTANESVSIQRPADGEYTILVHGWNVPGGSAPFTLTIDAIQGTDVRLSGLPSSIPAGGSATLTVAWDASGKPAGTYKGVVFFGPAAAPTLFRVPVTVTVP